MAYYIIACITKDTSASKEDWRKWGNNMGHYFLAIRSAWFQPSVGINRSWPADADDEAGGSSLWPLNKYEKHQNSISIGKGIVMKLRPRSLFLPLAVPWQYQYLGSALAHLLSSVMLKDRTGRLGCIRKQQAVTFPRRPFFLWRTTNPDPMTFRHQNICLATSSLNAEWFFPMGSLLWLTIK